MSLVRGFVLATIFTLTITMAPFSLRGQAPAVANRDKLSEIDDQIEKLEDKIDEKAKEQAEFSLTGDKTYTLEKLNKPGEPAGRTVKKEASDADSVARQKRCNVLQQDIRNLEREILLLNKEKSRLEKELKTSER